MLDRGQQNDWFVDGNLVEVIVLVVMSTYFVAHTLMTPADKAFVDFRLFKNRNYVTGVSFIFIVGLVLYATRAHPYHTRIAAGLSGGHHRLVTAPSGAAP